MASCVEETGMIQRGSGGERTGSVSVQEQANNPSRVIYIKRYRGHDLVHNLIVCDI